MATLSYEIKVVDIFVEEYVPQLERIFQLKDIILFLSSLAGEIYTREPGGQDADKTDTVLLLDKNKEFKAFGSKALDAYFDNNHGGQDLLFEKFKMGLYEDQTHAKALNG